MPHSADHKGGRAAGRWGAALSRRFTLAVLLGVAFRADLSWPLFLVLLVWTLAVHVFPVLVPELPDASYWWMAVAATLAHPLLIVLREIASVLAARLMAIPVAGTTLRIFGGGAETHSDETAVRGELLMAASGFIVSLLLGTLFFFAFIRVADPATPLAVAGVLFYLALLSWGLAALNLIPAYPLDGGRILRALTALWTKDMRRATRIAAGAGSLFGVLFVIAALVLAIRGDFIVAIWAFVAGLLLKGAAGAAYPPSRAAS